MKIHLIVLLLNGFFMISCGNKDTQVIENMSNQLPQEEISQNAVIIGELDWISERQASLAEKAAAKPVGLLSIPSRGSRCTAFLITHSIIMTNNHCIRRESDAIGAKITFNYTSDSSDKVTYKCDTFLRTNKELDYTLLECQNKPGLIFGKVYFSNKDNYENDLDVLITHYNCDYYDNSYCTPYLKFSRGKVIGYSAPLNKIYYDADTLGGSSGSPVFYQNTTNEKYYLIALHNLGYGDYNEDGRGTHNSGVASNALLADISEWYKNR